MQTETRFRRPRRRFWPRRGCIASWGPRREKAHAGWLKHSVTQIPPTPQRLPFDLHSPLNVVAAPTAPILPSRSGSVTAMRGRRTQRTATLPGPGRSRDQARWAANGRVGGVAEAATVVTVVVRTVVSFRCEYSGTSTACSYPRSCADRSDVSLEHDPGAVSVNAVADGERMKRNP